MSKHFGNPVWERTFSTRPWGQYPSEEAIRFVKRAQAAVAGRAALDIGAGQGACTWMLMREGFKVTAVDGAPAGLARIPETIRSFGCVGSAETILGDITRPEGFLAGRKFDLMLDHYCLYANPREDVLAAIRAYRGLLAGGGMFLGCFFGKRTASFGEGRALGEDSYDSIPEGLPLSGVGRVTWFDLPGLEAAFRDAGFAIRYTETLLQEDARGGLEKIIVCAAPAMP